MPLQRSRLLGIIDRFSGKKIAAPLVRYVGFVPMPATLLVALTGIAVGYAAAAELTKHWFYRRTPRRRRVRRVIAAP
jgi:hypothetical protein